MKNKTLKLLVVLMVIVMALGVFAACKDKAPEVTKAPEDTTKVEETAEPLVEPAANLNSVTFVEVNEASVVTQLSADEIDIFAGSMPGKYRTEIEAAGLSNVNLPGTYYELMTNNAHFDDGSFNPFTVREFRVGLSKLVDRDYICSEIFDGAAMPRYFVVSAADVDYAKYVEYARAAEASLSHDKEAAIAMMQKVMADAGIEKNADGFYEENGEEMVLVFLIRNEDGVRQNIGDYVSNLLEEVGFKVDRQYKNSGECWGTIDSATPQTGHWDIYTGGWGASGLVRDSGINWHDMNSPDSRYGMPEFACYEISDEFNTLLEDVAYNKYSSVEERDALFAQIFELEAYYSNHIWLADSLAYTVWDNDVSTSYNLAAGVDGSSLTAYSLRFNDRVGGELVWANQAAPLNDPVNPIAGTNQTYDHQYLRFTYDYLFLDDPYTGLQYPKRAEGMDVVVETGLPVGKTYDWVNLSFEDEIVVPSDAMIDWDVESETWILADEDYLASKVADAEAAVAAAEEALADANAAAKAGPEADSELTQADLDDMADSAEAALTSAQEELTAAQETADKGYLNAKVKTTVYIGSDLSEYTWHDGTPITLADIMMVQIMGFATAYEDSDLYDEYIAASFLSSLELAKGWKIVSEDPIVIEVYLDNYSMDAELNMNDIGLGWTYDSTGAQASWSAVAAGNEVVRSGLASYSSGGAADNDAVEWLNYIDGPCLDYLKDAYEKLAEESYIPFEATMGKYITPEEAKEKYEAALAFYEENGHFVIGCGPYYISHVMSTEGSVTVSSYQDYKEDKHRWDFLSTPKTATVEVDGPASVSKDAEAVFEVYVEDPNGDAYPADEISAVKYLLFNSAGEIADVVAVEATEDGLYEIVLSADVIAGLGDGSCKIEVVVSPSTVASPSIVPAEFVVE
ncbi:MAG: ABC transporter substrate-binding protein [Eubacteriales bacterium]